MLTAAERFCVSHLTDAETSLEHVWIDEFLQSPAWRVGMSLVTWPKHKMQQQTAKGHRRCLIRKMSCPKAMHFHNQNSSLAYCRNEPSVMVHGHLWLQCFTGSLQMRGEIGLQPGVARLGHLLLSNDRVSGLHITPHAGGLTYRSASASRTSFTHLKSPSTPPHSVFHSPRLRASAEA